MSPPRQHTREWSPEPPVEESDSDLVGSTQANDAVDDEIQRTIAEMERMLPPGQTKRTGWNQHESQAEPMNTRLAKVRMSATACP